VAAQGYRLGRTLRPQSLTFVQRLREHGIPIRFHASHPGTHHWPNLQPALHRSLPLLRDVLHGTPGPVP
jgi:S-formylglutathione hydrolase FrmB